MELIEVLGKIEKRPNMFLGVKDLSLLDAYINGYLYCLAVNEELSEQEKSYLNYFSRYVAIQLNREDGERWSSILGRVDNGWELYFQFVYKFLKTEFEDYH